MKESATGAQFTASATVGDGVGLVTVAGEVDLSNVAALERVVLPLLTRDDIAELVLDLSCVQFLDSSAIAVLLRARGSGKVVRLREPSTVVRHLITVTGLGDVLQTEP